MRFVVPRDSADTGCSCPRSQEPQNQPLRRASRVCHSWQRPSPLSSFDHNMSCKRLTKAARQVIFEQHEHGSETRFAIETLSREVQDSLDFLDGNGALLDDFFHCHAVFEVLKDELHRGSRVAKSPRAAHPIRSAFHRRTLGPIEHCHRFTSRSYANSDQAFFDQAFFTANRRRLLAKPSPIRSTRCPPRTGRRGCRSFRERSSTSSPPHRNRRRRADRASRRHVGFRPPSA